MKILLAASEAVPYCKTGGLADVVGALARELGLRGHEVRLFLPRYRGINVNGAASVPLRVPLGPGTLPAELKTVEEKTHAVSFIEHPPYYDRDGLYGESGADYADNDRRFILLARGALEGAKALGFDPDVAHIHDWQTGLIAPYLKRAYASEPLFANTASVMTVHNMAYQGSFPPETLSAAGFGPEDYQPDKLEYYGRVSFLKAGLAFADSLTTVSPTYAQEIQESPEKGFGLEGLLRHRRRDLHGVINGIDLEIWNPKTDKFLCRNYSAANYASGKAANKADLQKACGLPSDKRLPLIGIVSRLDRQKGLDLALDVLRERLGDLQVVVLGAGDPGLRSSFEEMARQNPGAAYAHHGFDDAFAHKVYAGSDIFLMPSRFEPCGLGQMIAMRYGSLPVAGRTGGLADTVFEEPAERANGFLARSDDAGDLARALDGATALYRKGGTLWSGRVKNAMSGDYSWGRSVERYLELYAMARQSRLERR